MYISWSDKHTYLEVGALGEDGLEGAFALCPQVVAAVVVNHARLKWVGQDAHTHTHTAE